MRKVTAVTKAVSGRWKALPDEEKKPYEELGRARDMGAVIKDVSVS